ncbi:carboxymuconolactone decarboxylase family protein [Microbacterium sp. 1P10UB]|uniref:carboxymuconolactone decarboxylase family protein n=1 Tax=unclassified Microbacterium TaxID=2609290 RepID=UPI0039A0DA28
MIISPPPVDGATGHVADMYRGDLAADGMVFAHTQVMALDPEAHEAFESLVHAVVASIGVRDYELVTLAAAGALRSTHCLLAHGRKAVASGILDEDQVIRLLDDHHDAGFSERDVAMMDFAVKLSTDAASMTDEDGLALRRVGFTDRQIVDIALAAAARNYFSRALQALAVPVDDVPGLSPRLRAALTAGR